MSSCGVMELMKIKRIFSELKLMRGSAVSRVLSRVTPTLPSSGCGMELRDCYSGYMCSSSLPDSLDKIVGWCHSGICGLRLAFPDIAGVYSSVH